MIDRNALSLKRILIALMINVILLYVCLYVMRAQLQSKMLMLIWAAMLVIEMATVPLALYQNRAVKPRPLGQGYKALNVL